MPVEGEALYPLHKTIDHLLLPCLLERDGELVAVDLHHLAVAEFLVEDAVVQGKFRYRAGGLCDQFAFDGHRTALVARPVATRGERRLAFIETAAGLAAAAAAALAAGALGALPARR